MNDYIYKPPASLPPGVGVIAYLRDSGGPNQEQSIGQQERSITAYCKEYGLSLVRLYADSASGRKTTNRKQFLQMISDVITTPKELRPAGLLLWEYSRFSRDVADFNYHLYGLIREGLVIHSLTEEIPEGIAGQMLLSVKAYTNAEFSIQLGKRIKRAIADTVKAGYSNGGDPPKGYKAVRDHVGFRRNGLARTAIKWIPDPELAPLVVRAWQLRAQGRSYTVITKATSGRLYTSTNSWSSHFKNKSYLGIGKAGGLEIPDHHEPLISWELWQAVQKVRETTSRFGVRVNPSDPRRVAHPSILSGLAFCVYCGAAMVLHTAKDYRCYVCGNRDRKGGYANCKDARAVNARKADKRILDAVINRILSPSYVEALLPEVQNNLMDAGKLDEEIKEMDKQLMSLERSLTRLIQLAETAGDLPEIGARIKELNQGKIELTTRLKTLNAERIRETPEVTPEAFEMVLNTWRAQIRQTDESGDILKLKNLLAQFVSKIELERNAATIHYTFPVAIPSDSDNGFCAHQNQT